MLIISIFSVPDQWHTLFPSCSKENQSPIDIKTDQVVYDPDLDNFNLKELETVRDVNMVLGTNYGRSGIYYIFIELETVRDVKMVLCTNHGRSGIYYIFIELETVRDVKMVLGTNPWTFRYILYFY
jgi:hypothetical protein